MKIKETFLSLTRRTYPHGTESELFSLLPRELETDEFGNKFIKIGESNSMFTCHLDTASSTKTEITHVIDGNTIKTDGTTILGADDKAGVTILLYMIFNKVPGLYYFFLGEEVGCVGSKKLSEKLKLEKIEGINKVISFDRRGYSSVITHQSGGRCCSDSFATALASSINDVAQHDYTNEIKFDYKPDPTGLYTDSAQFIRIYPECSNISVGYRSEHCFTEEQNIAHLEKLANVCIYVEWEKLPISRDPSKIEYTNYYYYGGSGYGWDGYDDEYYPAARTTSPWVKPEVKEEIEYFIDEKYGYISSVKINKLTKKLLSIDLDVERVLEEKDLLMDLLIALEVEYKLISWDGFKLIIYYRDPVDGNKIGHKTECMRDELSDFLPELDFWKKIIERVWKENNENVY